MMRSPYLVLLVSCLACSDAEYGPDYARLGVAATNEAGLVTPVGCTTLPVLRGARVLTRYHIGGRFDVVVDATFERARLRVEGVDAPEALSRSLSAETLRAGFAEELTVPTPGGAVVLNLTSECTP